MRKHDIVIRLRGARFDQRDPEKVAAFIKSAAAMIQRDDERIAFCGCSGNALRLRITRQKPAPAPEPTQ